MSEKKKIKVGFTIGDLNGIGPELIIRTLEDVRLFKLFTPIVFTNPKVLSYYKKALNVEKLNYSSIKNYEHLNHNAINIVSPWQEEVAIEMGVPNKTSGLYALKSLNAAAEALKNGDIDVLVTAPVNKKSINESSPEFIGHTEYLQDSFGGHDTLMFMVSDVLKVGIVTNHIPVSQIAENLNAKVIRKKIRLMNNSLIEDFNIDNPKIAILGLNPHAGDNGLIGKEEETLIAPAISEAKKDKILIYGPYSADGFFGSGNYKNFDGILAMYHDQGLIPFKYIAKHNGVNFTAGLPVIRTSPDHGTANDLVGKVKVDISSFRTAIYTAIDTYNNRISYFESKSNKLPKN